MPRDDNGGATVETPTPKAKKRKTEPTAPEREVVYPEVSADLYSAGTGNPINAALAMKWLGWEEVEHKDASTIPEILALTGKHVRLTNNTKNRPLYASQLTSLMLAILRRRWRLTLQTLILGRTGQVLSGQHRLIALVLAYLTWSEGDHKHQWRRLWKTEPTMDHLVATGADEADETFEALNLDKPATGADVLYRSDMLAAYPPEERRILARMTDHAVKMIWLRTGAKANPFDPSLDLTRTPAETRDFLLRHPRILDAVKHLKEESADSEAFAGNLSPAYAAAFCYLMGCSRSDGDAYRAAKPAPSEKSLDWSSWDKACEFWAVFGRSDAEFDAVRQAFAALADPETGEGATTEGRYAVVIKAWPYFAAGERLSADSITPDTTDTEDGPVLAEFPILGGIDVGRRPEEEEDEDEEDEDEAPPPKKKEKREGLTPAGKLAQAAQRNGNLSQREQLELLKEAHPDRLLLFKSRLKVKSANGDPVYGYAAWAGDALRIVKDIGGKTVEEDGMDKIVLSEGVFEGALPKLTRRHKLAVVTAQSDGGYHVEDVAPVSPAPKAKQKASAKEE